MRKLGRPKETRLTLAERHQRDQEYFNGVCAGKNHKQAALDAGYSIHMARTATVSIFPRIKREFGDFLKNAALGKVAQRLTEGLDATRTEFAQFNGQFTDQRQLTDFKERREYAMSLCKLMGITAPNETAAPAPIQVNINAASNHLIQWRGKQDDSKVVVVDAEPSDLSKVQ